MGQFPSRRGGPKESYGLAKLSHLNKRGPPLVRHGGLGRNDESSQMASARPEEQGRSFHTHL